jgi:hypothetical protein
MEAGGVIHRSQFNRQPLAALPVDCDLLSGICAPGWGRRAGFEPAKPPGISGNSEKDALTKQSNHRADDRQQTQMDTDKQSLKTPMGRELPSWYSPDGHWGCLHLQFLPHQRVGRALNPKTSPQGGN